MTTKTTQCIDDEWDHHAHSIAQVIAELMDKNGGYQRPEVADILWIQVDINDIPIIIIIILILDIVTITIGILIIIL